MTAHQRPRRDQPRRLEVFVAVVIFVLASASGRLLGPVPDLSLSREQLERWSRERVRDVEGMWVRLRPGGASETSQHQPEFAGTWRTARSVDLDEFLDRALGVGYLKRTIATKASQTQRLYQEGEVVHLEISDRRGTARYTLRPDGKSHSGLGFQKMPIKQKARWAKDGSLLVEERYATHLGGDEHGQKCSGDSCPVIRSRRSLDRASGQMLVEIERTLLSGEVVRSRTYYSPYQP